MTSLTCNTLLYLALPTPGHAIHQDVVLETSTQKKGRLRERERCGEITLNALSPNTHTHTHKRTYSCQKVSHQVVKNARWRVILAYL